MDDKQIKHQRIITIVILILVLALVFRAGLFPYAIFVSQNNGLEETPLFTLLLARQDQPDSGDPIVVCKNLRCGLVKFQAYTEINGKWYALVKTTEAGSGYPIPAEDVKYRVFATIQPHIYLITITIITILYIYKKRLIHIFRTSTGALLLVSLWISSLLILTAYAVPAPPRNPLELPSITLLDKNIDINYNINLIFDTKKAELDNPEYCIMSSPYGGPVFEANGTIQKNILTVNLEQDEWLSIAREYGMQANLILECKIPLTNYNGTLTLRAPINIKFSDIIIFEYNNTIILYNPNPFPINISYVLNYYEKKGRSLYLILKIKNDTVVEPFGSVEFSLNNYDKLAGTAKIYYPWGVKYETIKLP